MDRRLNDIDIYLTHSNWWQTQYYSSNPDSQRSYSFSSRIDLKVSKNYELGLKKRTNIHIVPILHTISRIYKPSEGTPES